HAELADQAHVLFLIPGQLLDELLGARARDGADIGDQLRARHAHAVVADAQDFLFLVRRHLDAEGLVFAQRFDAGEGLVPGLVDGVGGIGNEFAEEYLHVAVQGVYHQVQKLFHLCLEFQFCLSRCGHRVTLVSSGTGEMAPPGSALTWMWAKFTNLGGRRSKGEGGDSGGGGGRDLGFPITTGKPKSRGCQRKCWTIRTFKCGTSVLSRDTSGSSLPFPRCSRGI